MARRLSQQLLALLLTTSASLGAAPLTQDPPPPDYEALYEQGIPFADFLAAAERRREAWHRNFEIGEPAAAEVQRARALPVGLRLLVVAEDACGDSVNTIPYLARLVQETPSLELRVIDSETGDAVLRRHRTPDDRGATPTVIVLDAEGEQSGAWVERPAELQEWFLRTQGTLPRRELYDRKYDWYDEDLGRTTVREIVDLLETAGRRSSGLRLLPQPGPTEALLQAVSPVDERIVWASGHDGVWVRTLDGGASWSAGTVDGGEGLQFRDVHAVSADEAWLLSAGNGELSRIYRTQDGGESWTLQFLNTDERAFFDCLAFWDDRRGVAFSDSVDGSFVVLTTDDGGERWNRVPDSALPAAQPGEGSFAASGTCVITAPDGRGWIGTGAAARARVMRTLDHGASWSVVDTPVLAGEAAGLASLVHVAPSTLIALGGDIAAPETAVDGVARSDDDGLHWRLVARTSGATYGAAHPPGSRTLVAVGPAGIDLSHDLGDSWRRIDPQPHWAVGFASARVGWAVGPGGAITRLEISPSGEEESR